MMQCGLAPAAGTESEVEGEGRPSYQSNTRSRTRWSRSRGDSIRPSSGQHRDLGAGLGAVYDEVSGG
jgi:hypothetical protein